MKLRHLLESTMTLDIDLTPSQFRILKHYPGKTININGDANLQNVLENLLTDGVEVKLGWVTGYLNVSFNKLKTLEGLAAEIGTDFNCANNQLTNLKGAPKIMANSQITDEFMYDCSHNLLTSLEGVPNELGWLKLTNNKLTSLVGIHKLIKSAKTIDLRGNKIKEGGIGLCLIEGLEQIYAAEPGSNSREPGSLTNAFKIISEHLGQGKTGLLRCQEALIDAGLDEFAKL